MNNFAQLCQDPSLNIRSWAVEPNRLGLENVQFVGVGQTNSVFVKNNRMYVCGKNQIGDFRLVNVSQEYLLEPTLVEFGGELAEMIENGAQFESLAVNGQLIQFIVNGSLWALGSTPDFSVYNLQAQTEDPQRSSVDLRCENG